MVKIFALSRNISCMNMGKRFSYLIPKIVQVVIAGLICDVYNFQRQEHYNSSDFQNASMQITIRTAVVTRDT